MLSAKKKLSFEFTLKSHFSTLKIRISSATENSMVEVETLPLPSFVSLPFTLSSASYNFKCSLKKNTSIPPSWRAKS